MGRRRAGARRDEPDPAALRLSATSTTTDRPSGGPTRPPATRSAPTPATTPPIDRANRLTLDVVDRVLNGENDLDGVTDSLARDLGDHHVDALHISALANQPSDPDGGGAGYLDPAKDHRIHLRARSSSISSRRSRAARRPDGSSSRGLALPGRHDPRRHEGCADHEWRLQLGGRAPGRSTTC